MRSLILALALAAPVSAVAAAPSYTNPLNTMHHAKEQLVFLTFVNYTSQDREVRIGDTQYKIRFDSVLHVYAAVGSRVRVYSLQNSKITGQELLQVSVDDAGKSVILK